MKKIMAYHLDSDVEIKFWSVYRYGFQKNSHFKEPIPMPWFPIFLSLLTNGAVWWLAILTFDVKAKAERVSRRHGLYRYTEMTEEHIGKIALSGLVLNLIVGVIAFLIGFESFARLSVFYSAWLLVPISNLEGSKIFFYSRIVWTITAIITLVFTMIAFSL